MQQNGVPNCAVELMKFNIINQDEIITVKC